MLSRKLLTASGIAVALCLASLASLDLAVTAAPSDGTTESRLPSSPRQGGASPCVMTHTMTADPAVLLLGEELTVTLGVQATCPNLESPLHVVLVLDGSGSMSGQKTQQMKAAAARFVRDLELPGHAGRRVGVVEYNSQARRLCYLTNNENQAISCINRVGANGGTSIDLGILEGLRVLEEGRPSGPSSAVEAIIVLADGASQTGCPPVLNAARQARDEGVTLFSICLGPDCDHRCMLMAASSPRYYYYIEDPNYLYAAFRHIADSLVGEMLGVGVRSLRVREEWGERFAYVGDSAEPEPAVVDLPADWLAWHEDYPAREGVTFSLRLRPLHAGVQQASESATGVLTDVLGRTAAWQFVPPEVTVLEPGPVPTNAPSATHQPATATATATTAPSSTATERPKPTSAYIPRAVRGVP